MSAGPAATKAPATPAISRPILEQLDMSLGKRVRLHRLLYERGLKNGTLLLLPIDQGLEHGPIDFFPNPPSQDPEFQWRLALEGNYNGVACHYGLARKYMAKYAGKVPLILKINGKTTIPSDADAFSSLTGSVEDAVALGADAVGYTLYVGSPRQDEDIQQLAMVREDCDKYNMPLIVWSYPRGSAIEEKGGRDSLYAVDYAARVALEMGADVVKLNMPKHGDKDAEQPGEYAGIDFDYGEGARRVVHSAGRCMVLFSGGSKLGDEDLLHKVRTAMEAGATGLIFGRNMWQRPYDEALAATTRVMDVLREFGT
ncbi:MAG: class I fructose-bisphosphate aldolase [Gemmatimonadota bacterium]|nr:MAG: class I fructose-bisphosphate aldolase [Gemmatimonadota bacterium]